MAVPGTWLQANLGQHDGFQPPPPHPHTAQVGGLSLSPTWPEWARACRQLLRDSSRRVGRLRLTLGDFSIMFQGKMLKLFLWKRGRKSWYVLVTDAMSAGLGVGTLSVFS